MSIPFMEAIESFCFDGCVLSFNRGQFHTSSSKAMNGGENLEREWGGNLQK